jgi:hypothetical protein
MSALLAAIDQDEAYRRHLAALSSAKPVVETAPPPGNPRLDAWRKRFARGHPIRPAADPAAHPARRAARLSEVDDAPSSDRSSPRTDPEPAPLLELRVAPKVAQPRPAQRSRLPVRLPVLRPLDDAGARDSLEIVGVRITRFADGWDRPPGAPNDAADDGEDDCVGEVMGDAGAERGSDSDFGESDED